MKSKIVLIVIAIAFVGLVATRISGAKKAASDQKEKPAEAALIRTAKVSRGDIDEKISFTGNIKPRNEVDVYTKVPGRVEGLQAQVGDRVRAGQLLATVEHKEIGWQAKAAEAGVQAATAGNQAAQATVKVAEAGLAGAKLEYERTLELSKGGSAPPAALDGARIKLDLANAQVEQAKAQVEATAAQMSQAGAASALAGQQVENSRLESPIAGVVTRRNINLGTMVAPQLPAFTIQDTTTLKLESTIDPAQFTRVAKGKPASITVDVFGDEAFKGHVDVLSPTLDPQTRRAAVEISIENNTGKLLPHLFAKAEVTVGQLPNVLLVPREAVLQAPGGAVVFRVKGDRVEVVRPKFGPADGGVVAVLEGLNEGDELAITGLGNLADGSAVKVAASLGTK